MVRIKSLFSLLMIAVCVSLFAPQAEAHSVFKKYLASKYPNMKVNCNACHVPKEKKEVRNSFGQIYSKVMGIENLSETFKSKSGAEKKEYEEKVMLPAFEKAFAKVQKMTYNDMVEAGLIDGIDPPEDK